MLAYIYTVNAADGILRARQTHVKRQQWNVRVFGAHSGHRIIYSVRSTHICI